MTVATDNPVLIAESMLGDLYRLVEAIDVRVPRPERHAETRIATEAAELRERAMELIRRIEHASSVVRSEPQ